MSTISASPQILRTRLTYTNSPIHCCTGRRKVCISPTSRTAFVFRLNYTPTRTRVNTPTIHKKKPPIELAAKPVHKENPEPAGMPCPCEKCYSLVLSSFPPKRDSFRLEQK